MAMDMTIDQLPGANQRRRHRRAHSNTSTTTSSSSTSISTPSTSFPSPRARARALTTPPPPMTVPNPTRRDEKLGGGKRPETPHGGKRSFHRHSNSMDGPDPFSAQQRLLRSNQTEPKKE
ncbi:hypothetical protein SAY87_020754 [Trapa incisa]|uniref:Uncharacterized protein n=1 Tax=Trapa incisa TaxID=236973 RepID=A0AAN7JQU6_9MYRT|nr:hypothetical protein SAY87_020754 [Trapa incisa]